MLRKTGIFRVEKIINTNENCSKAIMNFNAEKVVLF